MINYFIINFAILLYIFSGAKIRSFATSSKYYCKKNNKMCCKTYKF